MLRHPHAMRMLVPCEIVVQVSKLKMRGKSDPVCNDYGAIAYTNSLRSLCMCYKSLIGNGKSARSFSDRSFFMDVRAGCPFQNACFPGFGGPDRSFWPDVRRDIRPKLLVLKARPIM